MLTMPVPTLPVLLLLLLFPGELVAGCGCTTHNVIAHRALTFYTSLADDGVDAAAGLAAKVDFGDVARRNQDAFQAGCGWPDFGYDCPLKVDYPQLSNASECAHWQPFTRSLARFIRDDLPPPPWKPNSYTEKAVAFFMGLVSHQTADVTWHDLFRVWTDTQQGFLQVLGESDYNVGVHRYGPTAHTEGDVGGEFMCAYEVPLDFLVTDWYVPIEAVGVAFRKLGITATQLPDDVALSCFGVIYAEVQAVRDLASQLIYPYFAAEAPFLVDTFQTAPNGGVDDNAAWTARCWNEAVTLLQNDTFVSPGAVCLVNNQWSWPMPGSAAAPRPFASVYEATAVGRRRALAAELAQRKDGGETTLGAFLPHVERVDLDGRVGYVMRAPSGGAGGGGGGGRNKGRAMSSPPSPSSLAAAPTKESVSTTCDRTSSSKQVELRGAETAYSDFGSAMAVGDLDGDGRDDVVVGGPAYTTTSAADGEMSHRGVVYVYFSSSSSSSSSRVSSSSSAASPALAWMGPGATEAGRFGHALLVVDINDDGHLDLLVGAPRSQAGTLMYEGVVYAYFGPLKPSSSPPAATRCSNSASSSPLPPELAPKPDAVFRPPRRAAPFATFGEVLTAVDLTGDGRVNDVLIGAPRSMAPGAVPPNGTAGQMPWQFGALYAVVAEPEPALQPWSLAGDARYERFGVSAVVAPAHVAGGAAESMSPRLLIVGAPGFNAFPRTFDQRGGEHGRLHVFELPPAGVVVSRRRRREEEADSRRALLDKPTLLGRVYGDDSYTRLGASLASVAVDEGSPSTTTTVVLGLPTAETPRQHEWDLPGIQAGSVWLVDASQFISSLNSSSSSGSSSGTDLPLSRLPARSRLRGEQPYARFGFRVGALNRSPTNKRRVATGSSPTAASASSSTAASFWATQPYRDSFDAGLDSGALFTFAVGGVPAGNSTQSLSDLAQRCAFGPHKGGLSGYAGIAALDWRGDGTPNDLVWTTPRDRSHGMGVNAGSATLVLDFF